MSEIEKLDTTYLDTFSIATPFFKAFVMNECLSV